MEIQDTATSSSRPSITLLPNFIIEIANKLIFPNIEKQYDYDPKDFKYVDTIESGRHIVKEYFFTPLKFPLAAKTFRIPESRFQEKEKERKMKLLEQEIKSFRELSHHPNIVDFYGLCYNEGEAMICMELMNISLQDLIVVVHEKNKFPEDILGYITVQILNALVFCKRHNYIHRDVKPTHILLNFKGEVKLCGFGESRILKDSLASTFVGTIAYWPPERFLATKAPEDYFNYDVRSDIWSLGVTLSETAYGHFPFIDQNVKTESQQEIQEENIVIIQRSIVNAKADVLIDRCFVGYTDELKKFVKLCLQEVNKRPKYDKDTWDGQGNIIQTSLIREPFYVNHKKKLGQKDMADFLKTIEEQNTSEET